MIDWNIFFPELVKTAVLDVLRWAWRLIKRIRENNAKQNKRQKELLAANGPKKRKDEADHEPLKVRGETIDQIDAVARKFKIILLVGATGAGKTTAARLFVDQFQESTLADFYCHYDDQDSLYRPRFLNHIAAELWERVGEARLTDVLKFKDLKRELSLLMRTDLGGLTLPQSVDTLIAALDACCEYRRSFLRRYSAFQWLDIDAIDEAKIKTKEEGGQIDEGQTVLEAIRSYVLRREAWPADFRLLITGRTASSVKEWLDLKEDLVTIDLTVPHDREISLKLPVIRECRAFIDALFRRSYDFPMQLSDQKILLTDMLLHFARGNFLLTELNFHEIEAFVKSPSDRDFLCEFAKQWRTKKENLALPARVKDLFAKDFGERYERTFRRVFGERGFASFEKCKSVFDVILASEDTEPLDLQVIVGATGIDGAIVKNLFSLVSPLIDERNGRFVTVHKSFPDWLRGIELVNNHFRADATQGNLMLAEYCSKVRTQKVALGGNSYSYLRKHGITHFIETDRLIDATAYASKLLKSRSKENPSPQDLGRDVLLALGTSDNEAIKKDLGPDDLVTLLKRVYQTDPLRGALDILANYHPHMFFKGENSYRSQLLERESYVVCFEIGNILGETCSKPGQVYQEPDLLAELNDENATVREAACYGVARLCTQEHHENRIEILRKHNDGTFIPQQAFGEALLNLTLQKRLSQESALKYMKRVPAVVSWQHNDINFTDAEAAYAVRYGAPGKMCSNPDAYKYMADLNQDLQSLKKFDEEREVRLSEDFKGLLCLFDIALERTTFYALGSNDEPLENIRRAAVKLNADKEVWPIDALVRRFEILFLHPVWNVGESAASIFAVLFKKAKGRNRDKLADALRNFWRSGSTERWKYHWKVRLATTEAAFILVDTDDKLFLEAVDNFYKDDCSRLRGLCIEDLHDFVCRGDPDTWSGRIDDNFKTYFNEWLEDEDCWVLDHAHQHLVELTRNGIKLKYRTPIRKTAVLRGIAPKKIATWKRSRFLSEIQKLRRRIIETSS